MDFLKKMFGGKRDDGNASQQKQFVDGIFKCENCGQERPLSQKKAHMEHEAAEKPKNVCEFC